MQRVIFFSNNREFNGQMTKEFELKPVYVTNDINEVSKRFEETKAKFVMMLNPTGEQINKIQHLKKIVFTDRDKQSNKNTKYFGLSPNVNEIKKVMEEFE